MWFRKRSYESSVTRWEAEKFAPNSILHVTVWWKAVENMVNHVYELKKWMENSRPLKVRPRARGLFILCLFRRALSCCRKITLQQHSKECCCKALIIIWWFLGFFLISKITSFKISNFDSVGVKRLDPGFFSYFRQKI